MDFHDLKVVLKQTNTNFLSLPSEIAYRVFSSGVPIQDVLVEITIGKHKEVQYAGWSGIQSNLDTTIEMDPIFAKSMNLKEGDKVDITVILDALAASTIELQPLSYEDWEIIELHAGLLESQIIYQTRGLKLNGIIPVYASETINALCKVVAITPKPTGVSRFARLSPTAEIHVAPITRKAQASQKAASSTNHRIEHEPPFILLRGISLPHPLFDNKDVGVYEVYVNFNEVIYELDRAEYVQVSIIVGPDKLPKKDPNSKGPTESEPLRSPKIYAKLVHDPNATKQVELSRLLAIALDVGDAVGFTTKLEKALPPSYKHIPSITIHPIITDSKPTNSELSLSNQAASKEKEEQRKKRTLQKEKITEFFKAFRLNQTVLTNTAKLPKLDGLSEGGIMVFSDTIPWLVPFPDDHEASFEIGKEILKPRSEVPPSLVADQKEDEQYPIGQDELINKMARSLKRGKVGALLIGASGSGKSLIVSQVTKIYHFRGYFTLKILCNNYARESSQNLKDKITLWLNTAAWYNPSLLILEGIENLFPAEDEQGGSNNSQTRQLSEFFIQAVNQITKKKNVSILTSARSKESVNSLLFTSHCIEENFNLRAPSKETRERIVQNYLDKFGLSVSKDLDGSLVSSETEGYLPSDLKVLVDRIHHEAIYQTIVTSKEINMVTNDLFNLAIKDYVPSNLRGVKLQKSSTSWNDIGGLTEAKSILLETLEWPTKYAPIFKAATLRLRSGILLYGYPGCGKTLLASAVAGQCGLNFISVKGPEILNKYIGASEQSVRELFERAQAAKPCILFFDEFDSIAPKRGHDSTGVTDRVVNQMLTEMDGAEGLDGVYVLAATSRPDLIDSALLRPGRLDKSVICDMPGYEDRLDILKSITRKMLLADDVSMEDIAKASDGFSGADLQALGYNAYLQAVHQKLESDKLESEGELGYSKSLSAVHEFYQISLNQSQRNVELKSQTRSQLSRQIEPLLKNLKDQNSEIDEVNVATAKKKDNGVYIRMKDFVSSLNETKPSISVSEKTKLGNIYNKFVSGREGNLPDGTPSNEIGGRSTLM